MKLNPNCIRAILLTVEENTDLYNYVWINSKTYVDFSLFKDYTFNEIGYHLKQCKYYGYFGEATEFSDGGFQVFDLTPKGHEFLSNIRNEGDFKGILKNISDKSVPISLNIIEATAKAFILSKLGL